MHLVFTLFAFNKAHCTTPVSHLQQKLPLVGWATRPKPRENLICSLSDGGTRTLRRFANYWNIIFHMSQWTWLESCPSERVTLMRTAPNMRCPRRCQASRTSFNNLWFDECAVRCDRLRLKWCRRRWWNKKMIQSPGGVVRRQLRLCMIWLAPLRRSPQSSSLSLYDIKVGHFVTLCDDSDKCRRIFSLDWSSNVVIWLIWVRALPRGFISSIHLNLSRVTWARLDPDFTPGTSFNFDSVNQLIPYYCAFLRIQVCLLRFVQFAASVWSGTWKNQCQTRWLRNNWTFFPLTGSDLKLLLLLISVSWSSRAT